MSAFIVTSSGDELSITNPRPGHLTALTIAWSLSQLNRFTGHCLRPYSVAEHSLLVCDIAERELGLDVHGQFAALMHDAHECITGDLHTPGKHAVGADWYGWEKRMQAAVLRAFATHSASAVYAVETKRADLMALATEKRDLLPSTPTPWPVLRDVDAISWVDLYSRERIAANWEDWRDRWLDRYHLLEQARNQALFGCSRHQPPALQRGHI